MCYLAILLVRRILRYLPNLFCGIAVFRIPQCPHNYEFISILAFNNFLLMLTMIACIDLDGRLGGKPSTDRLHNLGKQYIR